MLNRRQMLGGIAAIPLASALPTESQAVVPKINLPLIYEESAAFCQTQKINVGEYFMQLFVTKDNQMADTNAKFPQMSFSVDRLKITDYEKLIDYSYDTPYDIIKQCPIREIKNTKGKLKFEINRLGTEIARKSRRGLGYVILCHPSKLEYVRSLNLIEYIDVHTYSELPEDEYVCLYNNTKLSSDKPMIDGAMYKVQLENHDPKYIANLNFKDYIIRFRISEI